MKTWTVLTAKHATLAAGVGLGVIPGHGTAPLDGLAVCALLAGAYLATANSPLRGLCAAVLPVRTGLKQPAQARANRSTAARERSGRAEKAVRPGERSPAGLPLSRSEERRVGKECRSRWA